MLDRLRTENREDLVDEVVDGVVDGQYSYEFGAQFLGNAGNEEITGSKTQQAISNSLRTAQGIASSICRSKTIGKITQRYPAYKNDAVMQAQLDAELTGTYAAIVEAEVAADEKYDILANTQQNLQLAEQRLAEKYAAKTTTEIASMRGGAGKAREILQGWTKTVNANGGKLTADAFSQEVVGLAKTIYKTAEPSVAQLQEAFESLLANAKMANGTNIWTDRQAIKKALRTVIKTAKPEGGQNAPKQVWTSQSKRR